MIPWFHMARAYSLAWQRLPLGSRPRGVGRLLRRMHRDHIEQLDGMLIYVNHRIAGCYDGIARCSFAEPETLAFLLAILSEVACDNVTFIDVGACIGEIALPLARLAKIGRVLAFEPQSECARTCVLNAGLNGVEKKIYVAQVALSAQPGPVSFYCDARSPTASHIAADNEESTEIPGSTLDAEATDVGPPCVLKIDVEGWELEVLCGGRALLARTRPLIVFEHNGCGRARHSLAEFSSLLEPGYRLFRLRSQDGLLDENLSETWNVVACHEKSPFWSGCQQRLLRRRLPLAEPALVA